MCPGPKENLRASQSNTYLSPGSLFNPRHKRNRSIFYADEILARHKVIQGLQRMEKVRLFHSDIVRYARADVESARVDANREFFDNFDEIVEDDAVWGYKFQREYNKKINDPDDIYLEIKDSE